MGSVVQKSLDAVKEAQKQVNANLAGTEYSNQLLELNTGFKRLIMRLLFMGAVDTQTSEAIKAQARKPFPTLKSVMAKSDKLQSPKEDAALEKTDKQRFRDSVEELLVLLSQKPETATILNRYTGKPFEHVLRGAAKILKYDQYKSGDITEKYVQDVIVLAELHAEEKSKAAEIEALKAAEEKSKAAEGDKK